MLSEKEQGKRLRFFREARRNKKFGGTEVTFDVSGISENRPLNGTILFRDGRAHFVGRLADFDFGKYAGWDEREELVRYLRIVLSEQFLNRILGESCVCKFFERFCANTDVIFHYDSNSEFDGRISVMVSVVDRNRKKDLFIRTAISRDIIV